jgi:hypothetical protein
LYPNDLVKQKAWMKKHQKRLLDKGKIEKPVLTLRSIDSTNPEVVEKLRIEANYFERNAERMRYPKFRRQHLYVGSGVIEAGARPSSAPASSSPACSGRFAAPTLLLPCGAAS